MRDPEASICDIVAFARRALDYVEGVDRERLLTVTRDLPAILRLLG